MSEADTKLGRCCVYCKKCYPFGVDCIHSFTPHSKIHFDEKLMQSAMAETMAEATATAKIGDVKNSQ